MGSIARSSLLVPLRRRWELQVATLLLLQVLGCTTMAPLPSVNIPPAAAAGAAPVDAQPSKADVLQEQDGVLLVPVIHGGVVHAVNASLAAVTSGGLTTRAHACPPHPSADESSLARAVAALCLIAAVGRSPTASAGDGAPPQATAPATVWLTAPHTPGWNSSVRPSGRQTRQQAPPSASELAIWKRALPPAAGNALLGALVRSREPFLVARMGLGTEPIACHLFATGRRGYTPELRAILRRDVGVYPPSDRQIDAFAQAYLAAIAAADVVAEWGDQRMPSFEAEQYVLRRFAAAKPLMHPRGLEPYYHMAPQPSSLPQVAAERRGDADSVACADSGVGSAGGGGGGGGGRDGNHINSGDSNDASRRGDDDDDDDAGVGNAAPWTSWLRNRTVLVVHPFAESIAAQYRSRRQGLFPADPRVLPAFRALKAVPCVQSAVAEAPHANWSASLEVMKRRVAAAGDFDVALLGCGGYGLPLAGHIRGALNRSAVYLGGAVQVLFGIRGRRWDHHPVIGRLYNDQWVRPRASETPPDAAAVEGGCYW